MGKRSLSGIVNGTTYRDGTPQRVVEILEDARRSQRRLCIRYGDQQTGRDWGDTGERMCGTVNRSTGTIKIPLLVKTARSTGGDGILDDAIVRITEPKSRRVLYSHPRYHLERE